MCNCKSEDPYECYQLRNQLVKDEFASCTCECHNDWDDLDEEDYGYYYDDDLMYGYDDDILDEGDLDEG